MSYMVDEVDRMNEIEVRMVSITREIEESDEFKKKKKAIQKIWEEKYFYDLPDADLHRYQNVGDPIETLGMMKAVQSDDYKYYRKKFIRHFEQLTQNLMKSYMNSTKKTERSNLNKRIMFREKIIRKRKNDILSKIEMIRKFYFNK